MKSIRNRDTVKLYILISTVLHINKLIQMNNIRKLKKKKIHKILNPQQLAQQKLFQISHQQDNLQEPQRCLQTLTNRIQTSKTRRPKLQRIQPIYTHRQERESSPTISGLQSYYSFRHKSTELQSRQLPTTHYIVIDQRNKPPTQQREKSARIDSNMIRRMLMTQKIKSRSVPNVRSSTKRTNSQSKELIRKKKDVSSILQVKNIKLQSKYPAFYQHIRIHEY